ncbi:MAG: hypothetical protein U9R57_16065 [Thermodesulfobacteriota bacterium]|nr:hypothetical protein [Thermodesulfobacteriota bacterium]
MKYFLTMQYKMLLLGALLVGLTCGIGVCQVVDYSAMSKTELQNKIAALELGLGAYVIGKALNDDQLAVAQNDNAYKAYPGTMKFKDGDVFVIVDRQSNVVIAVYKRNKKADKNDFKVMISELMMQYGEPTTEAHGKTIYWNFGEDGLISEELYRTVKSQGKLETLIVLATVKFSSSENVETMTDMIEKMDKRNEAGEEVQNADVTNDNYLMIQSDLLTKKYM